MGKREVRFGARIAGLSFEEKVKKSVEDACERHRLTEAEVVRRCVAIGLIAYEGRLGERIQRAASDEQMTAQAIVHGAVEYGLSEFLVWARQRALEARIRDIRDDLAERKAKLDDEERALLLALNEHVEATAETEARETEDDWFLEYDEDYEREERGAAQRRGLLTSIGEAKKKHLKRIKAERP